MKSLEQLIEEHKTNNKVGELTKMREEISQVINFVHDKVERMLDRGLTPFQEQKNLRQAQANFLLIEKAIQEITEIN